MSHLDSSVQTHTCANAAGRPKHLSPILGPRHDNKPDSRGSSTKTSAGAVLWRNVKALQGRGGWWSSEAALIWSPRIKSIKQVSPVWKKRLFGDRWCWLSQQTSLRRTNVWNIFRRKWEDEAVRRADFKKRKWLNHEMNYKQSMRTKRTRSQPISEWGGRGSHALIGWDTVIQIRAVTVLHFCQPVRGKHRG